MPVVIKQFLLLLIVIIELINYKCNCNDSPIIGILTQEAYAIDDLFPNEELHSFIAASYVKFVESAGGRVLPIWIGRDDDYYRDVIAKTNGILLPGGAVWFNQSDGYADAGQLLYNHALEANKRGDYYPIWATCLGMELLAQVSINGQEIRAHCFSKKVSLALDFKDDYKSSKLFRTAPEHILDILSTENVTVNSHQFCLTEANFTLFNLSNDWRVLSTNYDNYGLEFISTYESKHYPFYGVQFHPEKNPFEFNRNQRKYVEHTRHAVEASQYFGNFFMDEARKSTHEFLDYREEMKSLIYNYPARYSGILKSVYEQVYAFTKEDNNQISNVVN